MFSKSIRQLEGVPPSLRTAVAKASRVRYKSPLGVQGTSGITTSAVACAHVSVPGLWANLRASLLPHAFDPEIRAKQHLVIAASEFKHAIDGGSPKQIRNAYEKFTSLVRDADEDWRTTVLEPRRGAPLLNAKDFASAMAGLLKSLELYNPNSPDTKALTQIFDDTSRLFSATPSQAQNNILFECVTRSDPNEALRQLGASTAAYPLPSQAEYQMVFNGFVHHRDDSGMRKLVDLVRSRRDLLPNSRIELVETYILFMLQRGSDDDFRVVNALLEDIKNEQLLPNDKILAALIKACDTLGRTVEADTHASTLEHLLKTRKPPYDAKITQMSCHALVAHAGRNGGFSAAEQKALQLRDQGFRLGTLSLDALIETDDCPISDGQAVLDLALRLDCRVGISTWSAVVLRATKDHAAERALELYQFARRHSSGTDVKMVNALMYVLCFPPKGHPSNEGLEQALEVYYDLRESRTTIPSDEPKPTWAIKAQGISPERNIYNTLLRAISIVRERSQSTSDLIIQLLIDMRDSSINLDPTFVTSIFMRLLLMAHSHESAFKMYTYLREIDPTSLDTSAYMGVLDAFASLSFDHDLLPDREHYLDIIHDMRQTGVTMSPYIYTVILTRYARLAAGAQAPRPPMLEAVHRLHLTIKMDASITPDVALMNALMNAYNRLGAYRDALGVWEQLFIGSPPYDNASVSIVMDACGYAGLHQVAGRIWSTLRKRKLPLNRNNWSSWIECSARSGQFQIALDAFKEMLRSDGTVVPRPNTVLAQMLEKFSRDCGRTKEVRQLIYRELPKAYQTLPPVPRGAKSDVEPIDD